MSSISLKKKLQFSWGEDGTWRRRWEERVAGMGDLNFVGGGVFGIAEEGLGWTGGRVGMDGKRGEDMTRRGE